MHRLWHDAGWKPVPRALQWDGLPVRPVCWPSQADMSALRRWPGSGWTVVRECGEGIDLRGKLGSPRAGSPRYETGWKPIPFGTRIVGWAKASALRGSLPKGPSHGPPESDTVSRTSAFGPDGFDAPVPDRRRILVGQRSACSPQSATSWTRYGPPYNYNSRAEQDWLEAWPTAEAWPTGWKLGLRAR